ncbi:MAG TPA: ABC transporter substrate-binding protein [Chloroflexota bacterium]|nr:ABC transporter substrate-binding protein [Chloroflexota bacterium]HZU06369.1 ABC transporter substrate-binding protein [Chloroflexota bacterium]
MAAKWIRWQWLVASLAWLALACAPAPAAPPAPAPGTPPATATGARPPVQLRVGHVPGVPTAGVYLADKRGYFTAEGLEVTLEAFDAGERTIPAVATGQIDVAVGGLSAAIYGAIARGAELKVVAGVSKNEPGYSSSAIVVRKELIDTGAIRDLSDLRGRTVGLVAPSATLAIDVYRGLQTVGLSDADIHWVILSFPDQVLALANGAIDTATLTEPFVARAVQSGAGVRWKGMDELFPNHQLTVIIYAPDFGRDRPEAAQRFLAAYLRGARDYVDAVKHGRDRIGVFTVLAEYTPIKDLSVYEAIVPSGIDPDGELNLESMEYDQEWYLARGYLRERVDLGRVVDLRYRDAALQRLGRYTPRP